MTMSRRAVLGAGAAAILAPSLPPRLARGAATVTDDAGRAVGVPAKVSRVFAAGMPAAILIYTLAPDLLLGWPRANRPEECAYLLPEICARSVDGGLTGRNPLSLESVAALKPDLILDVGSTGAKYAALAANVERQTGIPTALLDGHLLGLSTTYEKLGRLIGRDAAGLDFGDYANMTLGAITNRIAFVPPEKRPRVYYARGPRGLTTALGGAIEVDTVELLGHNVAGDKQGGGADVSLEQILQWAPDAIVTGDRTFAASVGNDPAWAALTAVREKRVYLAPSVPFDWIGQQASGNRLIGLWWLAKLLHPDFFKEDLRELTRDFYAKFYHVTPTEPRLDYLLAGKA